MSYDLLEGTHDAHFAHALVDFAYRLLNQPESLRPEDGPGERVIIESLLHNTVLCRMVRFAYLTADSSDRPGHGKGRTEMIALTPDQCERLALESVGLSQTQFDVHSPEFLAAIVESSSCRDNSMYTT